MTKNVTSAAGDITVPTLWNVVEAYITIICACLLAIRPVFVRIFPAEFFAKCRLKLSSYGPSRSRGYPRANAFSSSTHLQELLRGLPTFQGLAHDIEPKNMSEDSRSVPMHEIHVGSPLANSIETSREGYEHSIGTRPFHRS